MYGVGYSIYTYTGIKKVYVYTWGELYLFNLIPITRNYPDNNIMPGLNYLMNVKILANAWH